MSYQSQHPFAEIVLRSGAAAYAFENGFDGEKRLEALAKLNIFVGANNSGKSRLMRLLASTPKLCVLPNFTALDIQFSWEEFHSDLQKIKSQVLAILGENDLNGLRGKLESFPLDRFVVEGSQQIGEAIATVLSMASLGSPTSWNGGFVDPHAAIEQIKRITRDVGTRLASIDKLAQTVLETKKLYIPTLRSLRDLGNNDYFRERTKEDYFETAEHVEIFTGRTLYNDIEQLVRGDLEQRETLRRFETWIGETFFRGEPVAIIPRINQKTLTIKIGNEKEQPIHNLGDGIQAVLILAFPLFVRENDYMLVFIEEPELFLHPWLQRVLLEMLSKRFSRHQYFLTTHSNHFLDLTLDIESVSVFAFDKHLDKSDGRERPPRYVVTNVSRSDRRSLELLGVRNSSVLLTNCTIWVEGITDRRYIAHWLDLYQQKQFGNAPPDRAKFFKEDLHYSFVEYSGGNITHWSFLDETGPDVDRLCGKLFLIADNDGANPGSEKAKRQTKLKAKLEDRFYLLPVREIENLLTPETLRSVLLAYGEDPQNLITPKQAGYAKEKLGRYIEAKIINDPVQKKRKASYSGDSGTVSDKVKFCGIAIKCMESFDSLSLEAQKLAKKVFNFIKDAQH